MGWSALARRRTDGGALPLTLRGAAQSLRGIPQEGAHAADQRAARRRATGAQLLELLPGQPARAPLPLRLHSLPAPARQLLHLPHHPPHARRLWQVARQVAVATAVARSIYALASQK